jgi:hypothetical protein
VPSYEEQLPPMAPQELLSAEQIAELRAETT